MKLFRLLFTAAGLAAILSATAFATETESGYVDVGQLMPTANGKFVEINLSPGLLKFAARIASHAEPDTAELIGNLKRIRVNVVGLDETNRAGTIEQINGIRRKLEAQGWTQMVMVREGDEGDNVDIHVKQRGEEMIDGLVITVIDKKGEAVFVNIVGNISADQIATVADNFDIKPLKELKGLKALKKSKGKHHKEDVKGEGEAV